MLILKIPVVYLCTVVFYAIRAEPNPEEGAPVAVRLGPDDSGRRLEPRAAPAPSSPASARRPHTHVRTLAADCSCARAKAKRR